MRKLKLKTTLLLACMLLPVVASLLSTPLRLESMTTGPVPFGGMARSGIRTLDEDFENGVDGDPINGTPWAVTGQHTTDCWFNYTAVGSDIAGYLNDSYASGKLDARYTTITYSANRSGSWAEIKFAVESIGASDNLTIDFVESGTEGHFISMVFESDNSYHVTGFLDTYDGTWVAATNITVRVTVINETDCIYTVNGIDTADQAQGPGFITNGMNMIHISSAAAGDLVEMTLWYVDFGESSIGAIDEDFELGFDGANFVEGVNGSLNVGNWTVATTGLGNSIKYYDDGSNMVAHLIDIANPNIDMYYMNDPDGDLAPEAALAVNCDYLGFKVTPVVQSAAAIFVIYGKNVAGLEPVRMRFNATSDMIMINNNLTWVDVAEYETGEEYEVRIIYYNASHYYLWINGIYDTNLGDYYAVADGTDAALSGVEFVTWANTMEYYVDDIDFSTTGDRASAEIIIDSNEEFALYANRGNGTHANPWVISDINITFSAETYGILVSGTTDHVLFKNVWCELFAAGGSAGIAVQGASNVDFNDVYLFDNTNGLALVGSNNCILEDLYIVIISTVNTIGMYFDSANNTTTDDVVVNGLFEQGIKFDDILGAGVNYNATFTDIDFNGVDLVAQYGVNFQPSAANNVTFERLYIDNAQTGIRFDTLVGDDNVFDDCEISNTWSAGGIGLVLSDATSNVSFWGCSFTTSFLAQSIIISLNENAGTSENWTFAGCQFTADGVTVSPIIIDTTDHVEFYSNEFTGYSGDINIINITDSDDVLFFVNLFDMGLNATSFLNTTSTNINFTVNCYGDYFDQFPYANATDMSMTVLNETYSIDGEINDTTPYYNLAIFPRNDTVVLTFEDENGDPVAFGDIVVESASTNLTSANLVIEGVLYDVLVYYNGSLVSEAVYNVNATGPDMLITLNCTVVPSTLLPIADFYITGYPTSFKTNVVYTFNFDGVDGEDPNTYLWTFGDGSHAHGTLVTHTYITSGTHVVTLTITDGDGDIDTHSQTLVLTKGTSGDDGTGGDDDPVVIPLAASVQGLLLVGGITAAGIVALLFMLRKGRKGGRGNSGRRRR